MFERKFILSFRRTTCRSHTAVATFTELQSFIGFSLALFSFNRNSISRGTVLTRITHDVRRLAIITGKEELSICRSYLSSYELLSDIID